MKIQISLLMLFVGLCVEAGSLTRKLCVLDDRGLFVSRFDADQNGNIPPLSKFGWINDIDFDPAIAIDAVHGEIIVATSSYAAPEFIGWINFYGQNSLGNSAPSRKIVGPSTGLTSPSAVALDSVNDEIFVVNSRSSITVHARDASGDTLPLRILQWSGTGIAVDATHDELFVTNADDTVHVFPRTAEGMAQPLRTIGGLPSGLSHPVAIVVDEVNDEIFVVNNGRQPPDGSITVYPRTADGFAPPLRRITGPLIRRPVAIVLNLEQDEISVATSDQAIVTFPRLGNGQIPPLREINRSGSFLQWPRSMSYDPLMDELVVTDGRAVSINRDLAAVLKYPRVSSGAVPPRDSNDGRSTGLLDPTAMTVDFANGEIWVTNGETPSLRAYQIDAVGDVQPLRSIEGPSTLLSDPIALAVDTVHDEILVGDPPYWVRVYPRLGDGDVAPLRMARLCTTEPPFSCPPFHLAVDFVHGEMFVGTENQVTIRPLPGEGYIPPRAVIVLRDVVRGVAADPMNDEILVATQNDILAYARTSTDLPIRQIASILSGRISLDLEHDEIFVLWGGQLFLPHGIAVYSRTANGHVPPLRQIHGRSDGLREPVAMSVCQ